MSGILFFIFASCHPLMELSYTRLIQYLMKVDIFRQFHVDKVTFGVVYIKYQPFYLTHCLFANLFTLDEAATLT